jgi:hypothetical protein
MKTPFSQLHLSSVELRWVEYHVAESIIFYLPGFTAHPPCVQLARAVRTNRIRHAPACLRGYRARRPARTTQTGQN